MNIKKKISVALAAALCCSVIGPASYAANAEEYVVSEGESIISELSAVDPVYVDSVKLIRLKLDTGLAKKVLSYDGKTSSTKVSYSKSRTKYFFDKLYKSIEKMNDGQSSPSLSIACVSKDTAIGYSFKGDLYKFVMYAEGTGMGIYADSENITILDITNKLKMTSPVSSDDSSDVSLSDNPLSDLGINETKKGKLFKFKYNGQGYYYEVFEAEDGTSVGFVFDTDLNLVMQKDETGIYSVKISTSVSKSEFTIPDGYEEISY